MREFTSEEKELIVNTPLTPEAFEKSDCDLWMLYNHTYDLLYGFLMDLDRLRQMYLETKDERYFTELVRLLPNSYKVVKL